MKITVKQITGIASAAVVIAAGWYGIDRVFIQQLPLFPFSLKKAKEKKADNALGTVEEKLEKLMAENKIHGFGTMVDLKTRENYIGIMESPMAKAQ